MFPGIQDPRNTLLIASPRPPRNRAGTGTHPISSSLSRPPPAPAPAAPRPPSPAALEMANTTPCRGYVSGMLPPPAPCTTPPPSSPPVAPPTRRAREHGCLIPSLSLSLFQRLLFFLDLALSSSPPHSALVSCPPPPHPPSPPASYVPPPRARLRTCASSLRPSHPGAFSICLSHSFGLFEFFLELGCVFWRILKRG